MRKVYRKKSLSRKQPKCLLSASKMSGIPLGKEPSLKKQFNKLQYTDPIKAYTAQERTAKQDFPRRCKVRKK